MVEADRDRAEKAVEVDQARVGRRIIQIRAAAFLEIDDDLETIEQDMLLEIVRRTSACGSGLVVWLALLWRRFEVRAASVSTGGILIR